MRVDAPAARMTALTRPFLMSVMEVDYEEF
jgi:hypothetical protein